jgi:peptide/nickel transport system ATP-binding protein
VAIARALAAEPALLVCYEVTSALDVSVQAAIIELPGQLRNEMGLSLLFITHDLTLIRTVADRVAVVTGGHIVEFGPCEQIFTSPGADYTSKLTGRNAGASRPIARTSSGVSRSVKG